MRIIGGTARGRRLQGPSKGTAKSPGLNIRPTADRARESLFNIIGAEILDAAVLDLFAGTGALGLEALSRAAGSAVFIDSSREAIQLIAKNIDLCHFSDRSIVFKRDLTKGLGFLEKQLPGKIFDIVFIDPPYRKGYAGLLLNELAVAQIVRQDGLVVVEDAAQAELPANISGFVQVDARRYGDTGFRFYRQNSLDSRSFVTGEKMHG